MCLSYLVGFHPGDGISKVKGASRIGCSSIAYDPTPNGVLQGSTTTLSDTLSSAAAKAAKT